MAKPGSKVSVRMGKARKSFLPISQPKKSLQDQQKVRLSLPPVRLSRRQAAGKEFALLGKE